VVSAYALHHLNLQEKAELMERCRARLKEDGWFLNADLVVSEDEFLEALTQQMRVAGIVDRAEAGTLDFARRPTRAVSLTNSNATNATSRRRKLTTFESCAGVVTGTSRCSGRTREKWSAAVFARSAGPQGLKPIP